MPNVFIHTHSSVRQFPVRDHRTTLRVLPITDGNRLYVEWSSRFDIDPKYEAQLVDLMNRNFVKGLQSPARKFDG
jgi:hypothetical protein